MAALPMLAIPRGIAARGAVLVRCAGAGLSLIAARARPAAPDETGRSRRIEGSHPRTAMPFGPLAAALAYVVWGIFPLYFRSIAAVPAIEIVLHRSWWSMVLVFALLAATRRLAWLRALPGGRRTVALTGLSALLLSGNWLLYVWAVNADRVLDASLGYFINPLVSVLLRSEE